MFNTFYKMPFDPELAMTEGATLPSCSLPESIAHNLMLLITSRKGENRFDQNYGNAVWDLEFDNGVTTVEWESVFQSSLADQIAHYEPRISYPRIDIHIEYVEHSYGTKDHVEIKKKAKIGINAIMSESGEKFSFSTHLFLSPMSID